MPLVWYGLYTDDEISRAAEWRRRREMIERARILREALAFCIQCHHPLVATDLGFQFCPYERAGQHEKIKAAAESEQRESAVGASGARARIARSALPRAARPRDYT